ncbi:MAG: hypothetical protein JWP03_2390 [Phycisphaerales bacterium]|nr:hypothetical protein [Phycisphaerales bacterium]
MKAESEKLQWQFPGCPDAPNWSLDFRALVSRFPWLRAMAGCPQDPQWHAEGDVLTHVRMVCEQLVAMDAWRALAAADRHLVFAAAMLHDVAKPMFTKMEDGRIRSGGHAVGGTRIARRILAEDPAFGPTGTPFPLREQICALVRHHGLPSTFLDKADPQRAVLTASMTARCDLLAILAEADMRGRIYAGRDDAVDRVALFRDFIDECGCKAAPYPFASDHSRFHYFRTPGIFPTIDLFDASHCTVTLLSGLPAAGKDSWVRGNAGDQPVIALDALREELDIDPGNDQGSVVHAAKARAKVFLRRHQSFVWNATNTTRMLRDGLIDLFTAYGSRVRIVYCEAPFAEIGRRNSARNHPVPQRIIEKLNDHLDVPDLTEAHEVVYAIA